VQERGYVLFYWGGNGQPSKNSLKTIIEWLLKQKPRGFGLELFVFALYRAQLKERLFVLLLSGEQRCFLSKAAVSRYHTRRQEVLKSLLSLRW